MNISRTIASITFGLAIASSAAASALAETAPNAACPSGYNLVVDMCISDTTGDVVIPVLRK